MVSRIYNTLLLADSRAVELEQITFNQMLLSKIENYNIIVTAIRGAKIKDIVHYANTNLTASQYDLIYLLAGVNNLSVKHRYLNTANLVEVMFDKFVEAKMSHK